MNKEKLYQGEFGAIHVLENFKEITNTELMLLDDERILCRRKFQRIIYPYDEGLKLLESYLKLFTWDRREISDYGFEAIGYDKYKCQDIIMTLQMGKFAKECNVKTKNLDWNNDSIPLIQSPLEYLKIFAKDHFEILPGSMRDKLLCLSN